MPLLTPLEALNVSDSFLSSLYGEDIFSRWKELKEEMEFLTEREYVSWLIDMAYYYRREGGTISEIPSSITINRETLLPQIKETPINKVEHVALAREESQLLPLDDSALTAVDDCSLINNDADYNPCDSDITAVVGQQTVSLPAVFPNVSSDICTGDGDNFIVSSELTVDNLQMKGYVECVEENGTNEDDELGAYCSEFGDEERVIDMDPEEQIILSSDNEDAELQDIMLGSSVDVRMVDGSEAGVGCGSPQRLLQCAYCSYRPRTNKHSDIKRHVKSVHKRLKPFECKHCSYQSAIGNTLKNHLISKHGYKSQWSCQVCGKYFPKPYMLQMHEKSCVT